MTVVAFAAHGQTTATVTIQANRPGAQISSNLFGTFFEEINSAGEGGIYAEMVRNRSFEEPGNTNYWQLIASGGATGSISPDASMPLSASNLFSLRLTQSSASGSVGVASGGFWGMNFQAGRTYNLNFYARSTNGFGGELIIRLENSSGSPIYALTSVTGITGNWQKFSASLVPNANNSNGRLSLSLSQAGTVWLDMVSLFPQQTFHNRPNGLRPDLANMVAGLQPSFMRFPGGTFVEGDYLTNAFRWKQTIGDLGDRAVVRDFWGYYVNNGLGFYEYLQMCEDLGAQPLFVISCGMDWNGNAVPLNQMGPWVQDALDAIAYANGPTNSTWGARRAADGHPAPFNLQFIEIGNENGGSAYNSRYPLFYDAIKSNYPDIHIIADNWGGLPTSRPVEISDEHYYSDQNFFVANATKYDGYSRSGPKIYVGEYAVTTGAGTGNLYGALGEAAFMTGLERNADIVAMASYAPLFANLNNENWNPDLIYFNNNQVYGAPSYYVQEMFSQNRGDVVLPLTLAVTNASGAGQWPHGGIGLGAWNTQVQYTNMVVSSNGVALYQSDFTSGATGWTVFNGAWSTGGGLYQQTAITTDCRASTGNTNWSNYTVTLRARKTGGSEGFLVMFNRVDDNNWTWWNIGGWNNTLDGLEQMVNGTKSLVGSQISASVQNNVWYDIRIVLAGQHIQCYLNNALIQDASYPVMSPLLASASYSAASGQIVVKAVNVSVNQIATTFNLNGLSALASQASLEQLTSASQLDGNSPAQPAKVSPANSFINNAGTNFNYTFPSSSLSIIRLQTPPASPIQIGLNVGANVNDLASLPNGIPVGINTFITNSVSVDYTIESAGGTIVTSGTIQIVPGMLATNILLPSSLLQPGTFFRVTLSNPVNSQLAGVARACFVENSLPDHPLQIGLARFSDENLIYWTDPSAILQESTNMMGPWTTNNSAGPIRIPESQTSEFFRLVR